VVALIARHKNLDPASVNPGAALSDLNISSLDAITIVYELEEELGIEVPNEELQSLGTVRDIIDGLRRLMAEQAPDL
jgi:acyl carrier protein